MKNIASFIIPILIMVVFSSCEKVVDVQVKGADKKYVVEGVLTNEAGGCFVKISQTINLKDENTLKGISGASVVIRDERGVLTSLYEAEPGVYQSNLVGTPGATYTLEVRVGNEQFHAESTMPRPVTLDSLYTSSMDMMGEQSLMPNVVFNDPTGKGNAYRFVQYLNGKKDKHIFVMDDQLSDGRPNVNTLFQGAEKDEDKIKKGDRLLMEMHCIDPKVYKYWFSLVQGAMGGDGAASPANPVTNLVGGALGYFSAHTVSQKSIVVK